MLVLSVSVSEWGRASMFDIHKSHSLRYILIAFLPILFFLYEFKFSETERSRLRESRVIALEVFSEDYDEWLKYRAGNRFNSPEPAPDLADSDIAKTITCKTPSDIVLYINPVYKDLKVSASSNRTLTIWLKTSNHRLFFSQYQALLGAENIKLLHTFEVPGPKGWMASAIAVRTPFINYKVMACDPRVEIIDPIDISRRIFNLDGN
jgi:hypothetical protein